MTPEIDQTLAPAQAVVVPDGLSSFMPAVKDIEPFVWNSGYHFQLLVQKFEMPFLPKGAKQYLELEAANGWVEDEFTPEEWSEKDAIGVASGQIGCPHCKGKNSIPRPFHGAVTGIRILKPVPCRCQLYRLFYHYWLNPANVPLDYRNVNLFNLLSYRKNFSTFVKGPEGNRAGLEDLLAKVTEFYTNCYLLVGPAGTGKTTLMIAMYHRALMGWAIRSFQTNTFTPAVWKVNATALEKQFHAWAMRGDMDPDEGPPIPVPEVTETKVMCAVRAGHIPFLFIDELDKFKMTSEFQAKQFSEVINAIQSNGGQVFASSNLGVKALTDALGSQFGPALVRRLVGPRLNPAKPDVPDDPSKGGFLIDFWAGKIHQNYEIDKPRMESIKPAGGNAWLSTEDYKKKKQAERAEKAAAEAEAKRVSSTSSAPEASEPAANPRTSRPVAHIPSGAFSIAKRYVEPPKVEPDGLPNP